MGSADEDPVETGIDVAAAATEYLRGVALLTSVARVARYTVDHVRDVTGAQWAELAEVRPGGRVVVLASNDDELTAELMRARQESDGPPPPDSQPGRQTVVVADLRTDSPWPEFGRVATARTPVRSAVLHFFAVPAGSAAVLPVSDSRPGYFTPFRQDYVRLAAELSALALSRARSAADAALLQDGLETRGRIGVAVGLLAARSGVSPAAALAHLRRQSQDYNRRLRDLAEDVIRRGGHASGADG